MKRGFVLVAVLCLFLISAANPSLSSIPARVNESFMVQETPFLTAADGDVSSESIGEDYSQKFRETSADDTMTIPDACTLDSTAFTSGKEHRDSFIDNSYITTTSGVALTFDGDLMRVNATGGNGYFGCSFTGDDGVDLEATTYNIVVHVHNVSSVGVRWSMMISLSNTTLYVPFAFNNNTGQSSIETTIDVGFDYYLFYVDDANEHVTLDYVIFTQNPQIDVPDSSHFLEDFAGVSDWVSYGLEAGDGDTFTSDGDLVAIEANNNGNDNEYDGGTDSSMSLSAGIYLEIYYRLNHTGIDKLYLFLWEGDGGTGDKQIVDLPKTTSWSAYKILTTGVIESITFTVKTDIGHNPVKAEADYLRVGPADEMGWQHDGSTVAGVSDNAQADSTFTYSSDSDILTLNVTRDVGAAAGYCYFYIALDTTATSSEVELDYYPFFAVRYKLTGDSTIHGIRLATDGLWAGNAITKDAWTTTRTNMVYMGSSVEKRVWFYANLAAEETAQFEVDWAKACSIANFTVITNPNVANVIYVEDGVLVVDTDTDAGTAILNHGPALTVDTATYNVWNITTSTGLDLTGGIDFSFKSIVGGNEETISDETRRSYTETGTLTDFSIWFRTAQTWRISAIKFWEDATAPTIFTFTNTPLDPSTASTVTIETISSDVCGVYTAEATAVVEPSGSSIGTVSMTLDYTTQSGAEIWSYAFSAGDLPEGRYTFELEVDDAANQTYEYLTFTVGADTQTTYIRIFDSLGDFVPFETFEVYRNGTRQYTDTFEGNTEYAYQIQVKDRWGESLNTTTFTAGDQELVVTVEVYSLKIMSWHYDFVRFNVTRAGLTYSEIVTPLEVINFRLYTNTYYWAIDYLNGTSTSGDITLTNSTALIVTGSTISDVLGLVTTVNTMTTAINITTTTISNEVVTIQLMFDWSNTTLYNQSINIIAAFNWENTTIYNQTVSIASLFNATNTVLYNQIILIQNMFNWENTTLFNQTISILNAFNATNTVIYTQTVSILADISNVNSTIYAQTVQMLLDLENSNSTLYTQTVTLLANIANVDSDIAAQTVTILADIENVNSTIYAQTVQVLSNISNMNNTIYAQTVTILSQIVNVNSTLYTQTVSILSQLVNVNSTIYSQTLSILSNLSELNATIFLVDDPTHLNPLIIGHSYSDVYCDLTIVTNWHNASISVYDNDVLRTGPTSELLCPIRYPLMSTSGTHNLSVYVDGGADSFWYNISYTVAEIIAFELEDWDAIPLFGVESYLILTFDTTWGNSTTYVYLNGSLQTSIPEQAGGVSSVLWMSGISGLHNYVFNVTSGAEVITITWDFYLPDWAETALVVRWDLWTFQDNYTMITLESNWMNCTYYVYLNSSLVATSYNDPVTLNFTRDMNEGTYNLTIHAYGGSQNYTVKNIRYIVTEEGVSYDFSTVTGGVTYVEGDIIYEGDDVVIHENPEGWFMDQGTAAIIAVGSFLVIFTAFLVARELKQRDRENREAQYDH